MAHNCVDWTASPPTRKLPLLVLVWGDDRVYTTIPKDFKTLEEVTRREFDFTADVQFKFSSSCGNLCDGLPVRITERVWKHISPYIGCVSVEICGSIPAGGQPNYDAGAENENQRARIEPLDGELAFRAERNLFQEERDDDGAQAERRLSSKPNPSTKELIVQDHPSDHEHDDEAEQEAPQHEEPERVWKEEIDDDPPPRSRGRRRVVVSEDEDDDAGNNSEREDASLTKPSSPPAVSPPREIKAEKDYSKSSQPRSQADLQSHEASSRSSKPISQKRRESESRSYDDERVRTASQSQHEAQAAATVESNDSQKLMIRVAHRASKQESKFTTKSSTKVAKVISGACKSFGLDAARATLYLIVSVDGEDDIEENLFPCDKNDTIARAGAEKDTETRFLLKIAGDA